MLNEEEQPLFDIRRLALLLEVVEQGSITAAAELMMYTPSAVSQQLRKLEQEVGQPLLNRRSRGDAGGSGLPGVTGPMSSAANRPTR